MTADQKQRDRAMEETGTSFAVEASAGTGKTSTLVQRICNLVLGSRSDLNREALKDRQESAVSISQVCAITFTEKAAGEMKIRLRREFEKASALPDPHGGRARTALQELEAASISTFHSLAVSLLKERPVEAGLDPRFTALDELQGRLLLREVWESWLNRALLERRPELEAALRQGIRLEQIRDLAETLRARAHQVRRLELPAPATDEEIEAERKNFLGEAERLWELLLDDSDKLVEHLYEATAWLKAPDPKRPPSTAGNKGAQKSWIGGKEAVLRIREWIRQVKRFAERLARIPAQRTFHALACWLRDGFLAEWESRKRAAGLLDFDDQLESARRLLASSRAARKDFQQRYSVLLVDEFQDTDPVQLEIVLLLSCTDLSVTDPALMSPAPGRLFIVGDPKQSIYRFRGADVETYLETVDPARLAARGMERLELTANFRSVPSILAFADEAFAPAMVKQEHYQSDYLPFGGTGARRDESAAPSVHLLGERNAGRELTGSGQDFARLEAARISALVARMRGSRDWQVFDDASAGPPWRPPEYGDIAILLPVLSRVDLLENALRDAGIPYVLEGGKFYYARSEVASAICALRSVANPGDAVSLYAALRSIFFGLSDENLLRAHFDGLPFDYRQEVPQASPLFRPYAILRALHEKRHERPASETFERLMLLTGAREVLAARGFQSLANLAKLGRQLRALQQEATFSAVVSLLATIDEEELAESESRLMEEHSDAVRILTVHKSKGLDFRIVILAGAGLEMRPKAQTFLADEHGRKAFALKVGSEGEGWSTRIWEELKEHEKQRAEAELLRLLYVALTRARDHLVISTHHKGARDKNSGEWKAALGKTRLAPLAEFLKGAGAIDRGLARIVPLEQIQTAPAAADTAAGKGSAPLDSIASEYAELDHLVAETPYAFESRAPSKIRDTDEDENLPGQDARRRAMKLGSAFHTVMERIGFGDEGGIKSHAAAAGAEFELNSEETARLERMLLRCLRSPLIGRARAAAAAGKRCLRELGYVRPGMEEGRIDLLFEEEDGWVLVDYKTDSGEPEPEKYQDQLRQYEEALNALGVHLKECHILLPN